MPKAPEWLNGDIQEFYPTCQGNIRAIQHAIRAKRGVDIAYMTISDRLKPLGLARPGRKSHKTTASSAQAGATDRPLSEFSQKSNKTTASPHDSALPMGDMVPMMGELVEPLSSSEAQTLAHYEAIIARGLKTFVEVGQALLAIREQKLYRETYGTFEDYLRQRWDLSRSYAHRVIDAAEVTERLLPTGNILPVNEAQVRPLTSVAPEQQPEVWQAAVETAPEGKITAKHVQATVKRLRDTTAASYQQQFQPPPDRAQQAAEWRDRFWHQFHNFEQLLERFKRAGGVIALVRDWDVDDQRHFLQEIRAHAKTLQEVAAHFEKVIIGEEAALRALASAGDSPTPEASAEPASPRNGAIISQERKRATQDC